MKNDFDFAAFDWDGYLQHRPRYPPQFYSLIYDYHAEHSKDWDSAYDIGTGIGNVAAELLTRFTHVTASDPSPAYVERARAFVAPHADPSRLAFATHTGEDAYATPPGSVDLVTVASAMHWARPEAVVARAHEALRPGGTLAVWCYRTGFRVEGDAGVAAAWEALFARWRTEMVPRLASSGPVRIAASNYDCVGFDAGAWTDVRRLKWIAEHELDTIEPMPSRVAAGETVEKRPERDWFAVDADFEWICGYLHSVQPGIELDVVCKAELERLDAAMANAGGGVRITFPANLQLATKR